MTTWLVKDLTLALDIIQQMRGMLNNLQYFGVFKRVFLLTLLFATGSIACSCKQNYTKIDKTFLEIKSAFVEFPRVESFKHGQMMFLISHKIWE